MTLRVYETIRRKRDGERLSDEAIAAFLEGYTRGEIPDYQAAALCMAVYFQGLDAGELAAWTEGMLHSGRVLDLSDIEGRKVDKHSTGGVGDKVSLCLAPVVAACGVKVPMVSGRGLGHTGGTLDKLESIPGLRVDLSVERFREVVRTVGACLIGQTDELAPADKKLYALRDVTATVESIPLIASSILSKKLAEGIDALVLDVKVGRGAFMKSREDARTLARTMVELGTRMGKEVVALLTAMDQPLGFAVGNALEVVEATEVVHGRGPTDLTELTVALAAEMLVLGGVAEDAAAGALRARAVIADGSAFAKLRDMVAAQGGDAEALTDYERLPTASAGEPVPAPRAGFVTGVDAEEVGLAAMQLGAGRATKEDSVDPAVGVLLRRKVGDRVGAGEVLCVMHVNDETHLEAARRRLLAAYVIEEDPPEPGPLVLERIP